HRLGTFSRAHHEPVSGGELSPASNPAATRHFGTPRSGRPAMKGRWILALAAVLVLLTMAHPVFAIFGFGDIVFDPSVFTQAVEQVARLEQQYIQLVETYQMIQNEYEHLRWMAKRVPVDMATRYRAAMTPWQNTSATSTYGTTDAWLSSINTG